MSLLAPNADLHCSVYIPSSSPPIALDIIALNWKLDIQCIVSCPDLKPYSTHAVLLLVPGTTTTST